MIDFKKAITFAYDNVKWYYLLFIFVLIGVYTITNLLGYQIATTIILFLTMFFAVGIIGTKISGKLKTLKQSSIPILKNTGIYVVISIIFFVVQMIIAVIGILIFTLIVDKYNNIGPLTDPSNIEALMYSMPTGILFLMLILIFIFCVVLIIIEIIRIMGCTKYFKTNKFEDVFHIGKYFKAIFTRDYLTIILFLLGCVLVGITIILLISGLTTVLSSELSQVVLFVLALLLMYSILGTSYSLVSDYLMDKK